MAKLAAKTYGQALFEIAGEEHRELEIWEEIKAIRSVLEGNADLDRLLRHPGIPVRDKQQVLQEIFGSRISRELMGFLDAVMGKERYGELYRIFDYYTDLVKESEKIGIAYVTTALPLSDGQKKAVEEKLLATSDYRSMEMHYGVDESIIGGIIIRIKDRVVDGSIKNRLNNLTKQLLQVRLEDSTAGGKVRAD